MATYCTVTRKNCSKDVEYSFDGDLAKFLSIEAREVDAHENMEEFLDIWGFVPYHVDSKDDVTVSEWRKD